MTGLTPEYLRTPIPELRGHLFGYRLTNVLHTMHFKNDKYRNSFFPDSVTLWNELGPELRGADTLPIFKKKMLKLYRPEKKTLYNIHDPNHIKWIFQLRVGLSPLKSHKKNHKFKDSSDDTCSCPLRTSETSEHFFFHCPNFIVHRQELFQSLNHIMLAHDMRLQDDDIGFLRLLLYGNVSFTHHENQTILKATINFVRKTSRFSRIEM